MTLASQIVTDANDVFLDTDDFAESITYTPSGGAAVTVSAIVNRNPLQTRGTDNNARLEFEIEIEVAVESVAAVILNGDTVALKKREGDTADTTFKVSHIVQQDSGMWRLGLN